MHRPEVYALATALALGALLAARSDDPRGPLLGAVLVGLGVTNHPVVGACARWAGGAAERARTNVQRRIRGAIRKIGESIPALGAYLDRTVRTGTFCSYEPL